MRESSGRCFVIAVSGISGAGKTTLITETARVLGEEAAAAASAPLFFDAYAALSHYPADKAKWLKQGADPAAWRTPRLAADLRALRSGISILLPDGATRVSPAPFVLLEEPFGRARPEMNSLIDLAVFLDAPREIALARILLRNLASRRFQEKPEDSGEYVRDYLDRYLHHGLRELYIAAAESARRSCDMVLDATQDAATLAAQVADAARQARGEWPA